MNPSDADLPPVSRPPGHAPTSLDWAREEGEADRVIRDLDVFLARRRRRRIRQAQGAVALVLVTLLGFGAWRELAQRAAPTNSLAAAPGAIVLRPETRLLADGSRVELKPGAEIDVDFGAAWRRITLRRGEAHFAVAKDVRRPFVVTAGGVEVRAVGTAFAVERGDKAIDVLVTEGRVAVRPASADAPVASSVGASPFEEASTLGAGFRMVVPLDPAAPREAATATSTVVPHAVSSDELEARLAWRVTRLEFAATPLATALAMFNEHGRTRFVLADPALGRLQVSGVLRADNTQSLQRLLEGEFGLVAEPRDGALVVRRP